jgi:hypothetical protein
MDMSKLPRLSNSGDAGAGAPGPSQPASVCARCGAPREPGARFCSQCGTASEGSAASEPIAPLFTPAQPLDADTGLAAWLSLGVGIIILFLFPHLIQYILHPGTTAFDATDTASGAVIPYLHSAFFWLDVGVTSFGFLLIVEGVLLFVLRRRAAFLAIALLAGAVAALNLFAIVHTYGILGFPVMCAIGVVVGVIICVVQWRQFRRGRA